MTTPSITVVVPTRNSGRTLERCLQTIRDQIDRDGSPYPVELVVVDNHSTDHTLEIARRWAHVVETSGPERSAQRNRGLTLAAAPVVLFIDSDMVLEPTVCSEVVTLLDAPTVGAVVIPETSFGRGFWVRCRSLERRIALEDLSTEAARGFRREGLVALGGFDEMMTGFEDWDLHDRAVASLGPAGRTTAMIHHDEGTIRLRTSFQKKRYYGQWMAGYFGPRGASGRRRMSPVRLLRKPVLLLRAPHLAVGMVVLKSVEAGGILAGGRWARKQGRVEPRRS